MKINLNEYEYIGCRDDGGRHYKTYRKIVDGKGIWCAQEYSALENWTGEPFRITYEQALGYEALNSAGALGRYIGKALLGM